MGENCTVAEIRDNGFRRCKGGDAPLPVLPTPCPKPNLPCFCTRTASHTLLPSIL